MRRTEEQDALHGFFALGVKYYHVQESFAIINRFLSGYTSDENSRKVSPKRRIKRESKGGGESRCLSKNVLTGEVWIMRQSYFPQPAAQEYQSVPVLL